MKQWYKINKISKWVTNILLLNLLWHVFVVLGLGIFGFFPSTGAVFAIVRKWVYEGKSDFNLFKVFKEYYFKDFFKLNRIAFLYYIGILIVLVLGYFLDISKYLFTIIFFIILLIGIPLLASFLYFFPVYVHFDLVKTHNYIAQSFLIGISSPKELFAMLLTFLLIIVLTYLLPGLLFFFNGVLMAFAFIIFSNMSFKKL